MNNTKHEMFEINGVRMSAELIRVLNLIIDTDTKNAKNTISEASLIIAACKSDDIEQLDRDFYWYLSHLYNLFTAIEIMKQKEGTV